MDIGKAFTYAFEDENWLTKVLLGGLFTLLSFILVGIPFVLGYFLETLKNVAMGQERPLPNWSDNLGGLFSKGLKAAVGVIIWAIPIILVSCLMGVLGAALGQQAGRQAVQIRDVLGLVTACLQCVIWLYSLAMGVFLPAALTRFAISEEISDFFAFGEIFGYVTGNLGNYIIALLLSWVASLVAGLGVILCFVGVLFTSFWAYLVTAHFFGQVYRAQAASVA